MIIIRQSSYYQKEFGIKDSFNNMMSSTGQFFGNVGHAIAHPVETGNSMLSLRTRARIEAAKRGAGVVGSSIGAGFKRLGQQIKHAATHKMDAMGNVYEKMADQATDASSITTPGVKILKGVGVNVNTRRAGLLKKYYLNEEFQKKYDALYGDKNVQRDKENGALFPNRRPSMSGIFSFKKPTGEDFNDAMVTVAKTGKKYATDIMDSAKAQASAAKTALKNNGAKLLDGNQFVESLARWRTTPNECVAGGMENMRKSGAWSALGAAATAATGGVGSGIIQGTVNALNGNYIGPGTNDCSIGINIPELAVKHGLGTYNTANKKAIEQEKQDFLADKETRRLQQHMNNFGNRVKGAWGKFVPRILDRKKSVDVMDTALTILPQMKSINV